MMWTRNARVLSLSVATVLLLAVGSARAGGQQLPIYFGVILPAGATLEVDGYRTASTGATRSFETPPVLTGKTYTYTLKATDGKAVVVRKILLRPEQQSVVDLREEFAAVAKKPDDANPIKLKGGITRGPSKKGYVTFMEDGRLWVFKDNSKELKEFTRDWELAKHVTRPGVGPGGVTVKAPDKETVVAFMTDADGFVAVIEDGRLWVFKADSSELAAYKKDRELARHVTRPGAGPMGMTIKAPDAKVISEYMAALKGVKK